MNTAITALVKQLTSKLATWLIPILSSFIATAVGAATAKAALALPWLDLSQVDALAIGAGVAGTLVAIIVGTLNGLTTKLLKQGTAEVQATLNQVLTLPDVPNAPLNLNGVAGPKTNDAARAVVDKLLSLLPHKKGSTR